MADKVKEIQIVALFKGGHDTLGTELMNSLTDKNFVCNRLVELHVFSTQSPYFSIDWENWQSDWENSELMIPVAVLFPSFLPAA